MAFVLLDKEASCHRTAKVVTLFVLVRGIQSDFHSGTVSNGFEKSKLKGRMMIITIKYSTIQR